MTRRSVSVLLASLYAQHADVLLELLHVQADLCDKPHDNKSLSIKLTAWITGIISIIAVILRFASRYLGGSQFWWDDWLQLVSIMLVIPMTVALLLSMKRPCRIKKWN